jgi:cytidylate kinase
MRRPTPGIQALIEKQAMRWRLERRRGAPEADVHVAPCVAISRLPYAAGSDVGERVAAALDYGFFGREAVEQLSGEGADPRALVGELDERRRTMIERFLVEVFRSRVATADEDAARLVRVIGTIGRRGAAVILGRGAPYLFGPEQALRVLVVGAKADRVARLAAERGLAADVAAPTLADEERARIAFLRTHFRVTQTDPTLYDVVVNTSTLGVDGASAVVLEAFRRRFPDRRRATA